MKANTTPLTDTLREARDILIRARGQDENATLTAITKAAALIDSVHTQMELLLRQGSGGDSWQDK